MPECPCDNNQPQYCVLHNEQAIADKPKCVECWYREHRIVEATEFRVFRWLCTDHAVAAQLQDELRADGHNVNVDISYDDDGMQHVNIHMIGPLSAYITRWLAHKANAIIRRWIVR